MRNTAGMLFGLHLLFSFLFILPFLSLSTAVSVNSLGPLVVQFSRNAPPAGYELLNSDLTTHAPLTSKLANEEGETTIDLQIGLVSNNMKGLEQALHDISTPGNSKYRKFLSNEEVNFFVSPSQATKDTVASWLSAHGLTAVPITPAGEWLQINNLPISKANTLLNATFSTFVHSSSGVTALRTLSYSIPEKLTNHVDAVHPGASFDFGAKSGPTISPITSGLSSKSKRMHRRNNTPSTKPTQTQIPASCATLVTPSCLQEIYNIPTSEPGHARNRLTVTGYDNEFAQEADLQEFLSILRSDIPSTTTFKLQTLDNGTNTQDPSQAGTEANLDIETVFGIVGTSVPVTFLSVGETQANTGLVAFQDTANFLLRMAWNERPTVVTTSFGFNEDDLDPSSMRKLCFSYAQLGVLGTSIIFSSGDGGVSGNSFTDCPDHNRFVPSFPSTCPFVTSVGGTTASSTFPNNPLETALFFSSGGFSNVFSTAWYQILQTEEYLRILGRNYTGLINRNGRGFPDVSALGSNVAIISGGQKVRAGGTSTSAPIFASVIALLNDKLMSEGRPQLGFLNPWLYSWMVKNAEGLTDVKSGSNPGCNTTGFAAEKGWDPVTGLGSPNFENLVKSLFL